MVVAMAMQELERVLLYQEVVLGGAVQELDGLGVLGGRLPVESAQDDLFQVVLYVIFRRTTFFSQQKGVFVRRKRFILGQFYSVSPRISFIFRRPSLIFFLFRYISFTLEFTGFLSGRIIFSLWLLNFSTVGSCFNFGNIISFFWRFCCFIFWEISFRFWRLCLTFFPWLLFSFYIA